MATLRLKKSADVLPTPMTPEEEAGVDGIYFDPRTCKQIGMNKLRGLPGKTLEQLMEEHREKFQGAKLQTGGR